NLKLLTLADEKRDLLQDFGVDYSLFLDFTYELASKSSRSFIEYLAKNFGVKVLLVGYDHRFGSDKDSSLADYIQFGEEYGVKVICCDAYNEGEVMVSSSKVRAALISGDVKQAKSLLVYEYFVSGTVVHGSKIGRSIGFPTANLQVDNLKLLPAEGVYAVGVRVEGDETIYSGMLNIGTRPTVDGVNRTVEVHIFDFNNDLYGAKVTLFFKDYVRKERKFGDLTELKRQLNDDFSTVKSIFLQNS
ncbi:MAG: riboflavin biosynthesis protein RibF, partial [bacterium]